MRLFVLVTLLFSMLNVFAQTDELIQEEINQNLWKPFKAAFETLDDNLLNSLYADQVLRVTPNGIDAENAFKEGNVDRFDTHRKTSTVVALDFWFDSRKTNTMTSYEVGFYSMQLSNKNSVTTIYGQFHIVLQKIDGVWKITQDWDTATINGNPITMEDFKKQPSLQFD